MAKVRIQMLRNLAIKPGTPEKDHRYEGKEYTVKQKEAAELIAAGLAVDLDAPPPVVEADDDEEDEGDELDGMAAADLKALAAAEGVTLTSQKKADVIEAIRSHREAKGNG